MSNAIREKALAQALRAAHIRQKTEDERRMKRGAGPLIPPAAARAVVNKAVAKMKAEEESAAAALGGPQPMPTAAPTQLAADTAAEAELLEALQDKLNDVAQALNAGVFSSSVLSDAKMFYTLLSQRGWALGERGIGAMKDEIENTVDTVLAALHSSNTTGARTKAVPVLNSFGSILVRGLHLLDVLAKHQNLSTEQRRAAMPAYRKQVPAPKFNVDRLADNLEDAAARTGAPSSVYEDDFEPEDDEDVNDEVVRSIYRPLQRGAIVTDETAARSSATTLPRDVLEEAADRVHEMSPHERAGIVRALNFETPIRAAAPHHRVDVLEELLRDAARRVPLEM